MIETKVPGSVDAVDGLARWMRNTLKAKVDDGGDAVVDAKRRGEDDWEGESGDAYTRLARDVAQLHDDHTKRIERAATKVEKYGDRLHTVETRMAGFRTEATDGGLRVVGTDIHPPATVNAADYEDGAEDPAYEKAAGKVTLYNRIARDVNSEWTAFQDWIDTNLTPVPENLDAPLTETLWSGVKESLDNLGIAIGLESGKRGLERTVKQLEGDAKELHRWRRSGNPARRAANRAARESGKIDDLLKKAGMLGKAGKVLGPVGVVIDTYQGLESDKPGGALIGVAAGGVATAVVIATAPVSVPAAVVVVGAAAVGVGVGWLAEQGWDALPDDWTDPVDDAVHDAWSNTKDAVGDGWDKVTGWF